MTNGTDQRILGYLTRHPNSSSKEIFDQAGVAVGYATVKRALKRLVEAGQVEVHGQGRGTKYSLSPSYDLLRPVDLDDYFAQEVDERRGRQDFNFELIPNVLKETELFAEGELVYLRELQAQYRKNIEGLSEFAQKQELERLAIDLSWKSSQIEGNTYTLLETERLLKDQRTATGKTREEATMLLNHKAAIDFIVETPGYLKPLTVRTIEDIHSLLVRDLKIGRNIRTHRVGISGTNYRPLDNDYQIKEALQSMCDLVNSKDNVFEKALLLLALLSYIQPFEDGNKRTARIVSNACLMDHGHCPLSFRTVDAMDYKKAMLVFYEQNNLAPFKSIFIDQFRFAVNTYF